MITPTDIILPASYNNYVKAIGDKDLLAALRQSTRQFRKLLKKIPKKKIDYAYAEGKWTLREVLQHLIDTERVFVFRSLSFARKDPAPLPGFDENVWAVTAKASGRKWDDLVKEFLRVRASTESFFNSLDVEQLNAAGTANNNQANVLGLGVACAGHLLHHIGIIRTRYLHLPEKKKRTSKK